MRYFPVTFVTIRLSGLWAIGNRVYDYNIYIDFGLAHPVIYLDFQYLGKCWLAPAATLLGQAHSPPFPPI